MQRTVIRQLTWTLVLTLPLTCLCPEGSHIFSLASASPLIHILNDGV